MEEPPAEAAAEDAPEEISLARQEPLLLQFLLGFVPGFLPLFLWLLPDQYFWGNVGCLVSIGYFIVFVALIANKATRWIGIGLVAGLLLYLLLEAYFFYLLLEEI